MQPQGRGRKMRRGNGLSNVSAYGIDQGMR